MDAVVYSLADPRDGQVRYVGMTTQGLPKRLRQHLARARRGRPQRRELWLLGLLLAGLEPVACELERVPAAERWAAEARWIQELRPGLLN